MLEESIRADEQAKSRARTTTIKKKKKQADTEYSYSIAVFRLMNTHWSKDGGKTQNVCYERLG